jgi:hypothetical protein
LLLTSSSKDTSKSFKYIRVISSEVCPSPALIAEIGAP